MAYFVMAKNLAGLRLWRGLATQVNLGFLPPNSQAELTAMTCVIPSLPPLRF